MGCLCNQSQTDILSEVNFFNSDGKDHQNKSHSQEIKSQPSSVSARNRPQLLQPYQNQNQNPRNAVLQIEPDLSQNSSSRSSHSSISSVSSVLSIQRPQQQNDNIEQEEQNGATVNLSTLFQIYTVLRGNSGPFNSQDFIDFLRILIFLETIPQETGLSVEQIEKIKSIRANNTDMACPICQQNVSKGELLLVLDCNHYFHKNCLSEWLERKNKCPMCRAVVNIPN